MKKILSPLLCFLLLLLTGCGIVRVVNDVFYSAIDGPESVTIEGVTYRRGFYGEHGYLTPVFGQVGDIGSDTLQKEIIYNDGEHRFKRVDFEGHDWIHSNGGGTTGGVVYCAEDQWEQMHDYYANPDNFDYYYRLGNNVNETPVIVKIPKIDPEKFDELLSFAKENRYDFGFNDKAMQNSRRLHEEVRNGAGRLYIFTK